jgi:hypothetical protein
VQESLLKQIQSLSRNYLEEIHVCLLEGAVFRARYIVFNSTAENEILTH